MPYFNLVAQTNESTVVTEYKPLPQKSDAYQSEAQLEAQFIKMLTETIGCGTGCATAVVTAILTGRCDRKVTVEQIGGPLLIEWDEKTNHLFMTGPSHTVFESEIDASHILQQDDRKNLYEKRITVLQVFLQPDLEIKNDTLKEKTAVKKKETIK